VSVVTFHSKLNSSSSSSRQQHSAREIRAPRGEGVDSGRCLGVEHRGVVNTKTFIQCLDLSCAQSFVYVVSLLNVVCFTVV
jgi:hypothetical protein